MCGIVGIITAAVNGFMHNEMEAFNNMLLIDTLRGFDSTGAFCVDNLGNVDIIKDAVQGGILITDKEYKDFASDAYQRGQFLIGHNRAATRGTITDKNAHPFAVDDKIVLVQNGTYKGSHKHHKDTEVDSEAVAHVLSEEPDIEKALKSINAAYALVWYNVTTRTLHMIRNDERPLWIAESKFGSTIFASEPEIILFAASRAKINLTAPPWLLPEYTLHSYTLDSKNTWKFEEKKLDCKYVAPPSSFQSFHGNGYGRYWPVVDNDVDVEDWNQWYGTDIQKRTPTEETPTDKMKGGGMDVTWTLFQRLHTGVFHDYQITQEQATEGQKTFSLSNNKLHNIELFDYLPANRSEICRVWYVVGKLISMDEQETPILYHRCLFDKSEEEVFKIVSHGLYQCNVSSLVEHLVADDTNKGKVRVLTAQFMNETPIPLFEKETDVQ